MLTKPFLLSADTLYVNVDADAGSLRVGICDEAGVPIQGLKQSRGIRSDTTGAVVSWDGTTLETLLGRRVRLKFTLCNGKLFSYWIGAAE